jgi:hypothetical protein
VALFVFLAAAAGAGIVAPDFLAGAHYLLHLSVASTGHSSLFELAFFLALESLFDFVN